MPKLFFVWKLKSCCRFLQKSSFCFLGFRLGALSFEFLRQNMMIGFGSYGGNGHGGGSSNLSALAPPFTVDRSIPKPTATPLVDLGEPSNWLDTNPYTFNSPQPAQLPQLDSDPITTPSYNQNSDLFEPKTYYPSYVSRPSHVPTFNEQGLSGPDHTAQWGGGLWDWEKGKAHLGGSFYSKETNVAPSSIYTDHINLGKFSLQYLGKLVSEISFFLCFLMFYFCFHYIWLCSLHGSCISISFIFVLSIPCAKFQWSNELCIWKKNSS